MLFTMIKNINAMLWLIGWMTEKTQNKDKLASQADLEPGLSLPGRPYPPSL